VPVHAPARARVAFVTLGCPKNEVDSDRMAASLTPAFDLVADIDQADAVVVNTCAFIREATEESIAVVLDVAGEWKAARADRRLVVTGCMPSRYGADLDSAMPEVDAFVSVADEAELGRLPPFLHLLRDPLHSRRLPFPDGRRDRCGGTFAGERRST
jgi:ribosomal protein S12 methylthiotransferase